MRNAAILTICAVMTASCTLPLATDDEGLFAYTTQMTGTYKYIDGDVFIYECGGSICMDTLVRDEFLAANVVALDGQKVTLVVRRVVACDESVSSQVACVRSSDGTALQIKKWVRPAGPANIKP